MALIADILKLHAPITVKMYLGREKGVQERQVCEVCSEDRSYELWPCATVDLIQQATPAERAEADRAGERMNHGSPS